MPTLVPNAKCWVCDSTRLVRYNREVFDMTWQVDPVICAYDKVPFWLARCQDCGFMQPDELPSEPDFFDRLYSKDRGSDWMQDDFENPYKDYIFQQVLRELDRRVSPTQRTLLDVGAHVGKFVHLAANSGWDASGIELNPKVAEYAAARTKRTILQQNAHQLKNTGNTYDTITLLDVLEHIPNPKAIMHDLHGLIRPGGWIAVKSPCGVNQWRKERIKTLLGREKFPYIGTNMVHVNHFSANSLRQLLKNTGFTNIVVTVGAPELLSNSLSGRVSNLVRRTTYGLAKLPFGVHSPLALNLQAYAQKA